jgi:glycerophosphoryl diester phosphodiesterase
VTHNIAHRGASAYEPENTLRAFERAIAMGATMLELDVHLSADGYPVVIHDAELSRTTNGTGRVSERTLAEIRRLDAGLGERVPTLAEAVELARGRAELYIELKGQRTPEPVVAALRAARFLDGAVAASFYPWLPQKVKFLEPALRTSVLVRAADRQAEYLEWALAIGADFVHPCWESAAPAPHRLLPPELVADIRWRGLGIIVWHEERPAELRELARLDVDGICTNTPDALAAILADRGSARYGVA